VGYFHVFHTEDKQKASHSKFPKQESVIISRLVAVFKTGEAKKIIKVFFQHNLIFLIQYPYQRYQMILTHFLMSNY
jgi:hypothetical protein